MNLRSITRLVSLRCVPAVLCVALVGLTNTAFGQNGEVTPPTEEPTTQFPTTGGGGTAQTIEDTSTPVDFEESASLNLGASEEDNRNQGFVGATAPYVSERNFVGSASQTFGALAEDATFGGGINDRFQGSIPGGGGGAAGGRGGIGGAGGFGGAQTSGNIVRGNLRTRLKTAFVAPQVPAGITVGRFNSNLARQPGAQALVGRYQVSIQNKTAYLTGVVGSATDANRLERQLRLQPGVYKIVNQLQIAQ